MMIGQDFPRHGAATHYCKGRTIASVRLLKSLCALATAVLLLTACSTSSVTTTNAVVLAADQTLRFPVFSDFGTLDPAMIDTQSDSEIAHNLFDGLVRFDNNLKIVPDIATADSTVSPNGITYTFKLRHDVTFSNGDKLTAKDVLYSWNRAAAMQGSYAANLSAVAGYQVVASNKVKGAALEALLESRSPTVSMSGLTAPDGPDGYTVQVKLSHRAAYFVTALAIPSSVGMIVDQNAVKSNFEHWWADPNTLIGTGAFKMIGHTPNLSADFAAVPNWWGKPHPTVTKVHIDIVTSASSAIHAYEHGSYDLYGYGGYSVAPIDEMLRIQGTPAESSQLVLHPKARTTWVTFNLTLSASRLAEGPFSLDGGQTAYQLRLAFDLAIDKTRLAATVCRDIICTPATGGVITKGLVGYLGDNQDPLAAFNPAEARSLLQAADPTGTKTRGLTYTFDPEDPLNAPTAQFLQEQWHDNLGVDVALESVPHSQFVQARLQGSYVLSRDGWQADFDYPTDWFENLWGKAAGCPNLNCSSGYDSAAYDSAVRKAESSPFGTAATAAYEKVSRQLIADVVYIPLYYSVGAFLIKPYVRGAGTNNFFDLPWDQIQMLAH
jgi:ABC-type oligopeptide transport system substrate-binding subunit